MTPDLISIGTQLLAARDGVTFPAQWSGPAAQAATCLWEKYDADLSHLYASVTHISDLYTQALTQLDVSVAR